MKEKKENSAKTSAATAAVNTKAIAKNKKKRKFGQIRDSILFQLSFNKKTVNQIADEINANWKTVDLHITFLLGKGMVKEIFRSDYIRIYDLTDDGRKYVALINPSLAEVVDTKKDLEKLKIKTDYVG